MGNSEYRADASVEGGVRDSLNNSPAQIHRVSSMGDGSSDPSGSAPRRGVPGRGVPENWFVDPVRLGVPGVRRPSGEEDVLSWQADSLCAQTDPEAFFPEKGGSTREAKKICGSCEVRNNCLEYALENDERFGIWGGLSERERRKLRKRA